MTTTNGLIREEDLKAWLGYEQQAMLEARLKELGIRYRKAGKGNTIVTTIDAVNRAIAGNDDFTDIQFAEPHGSQARKQG